MPDVFQMPWRELADISLTALALFVLLASARSARSIAMLVMLGVLTVAYGATRASGYALTAQVLLALLVTGCVYAVFISHDDVRRGIDRFVGWATPRRTQSDSAALVEVVVSAVHRMAEAKIGALIVFPGAQPLGNDVHGGVELDARLSVPLLLSLFDPSSPGHDGALVIREGRGAEFAVHLPLSTNEAALGEHGTRHAAALGLSEQTDAMCVVVSEERGQVSVGTRGELRPIQPSQLVERLTAHLAGRDLQPRRRAPSRWLRHALNALVAVVAATAGWLATVQGNQEASRTLEVPVELHGLPEGYNLASSDPPTVEVTVSGPKNELLLLSDRDVDLGIDGWAVKNGRRTFFLSRGDVRAPGEVEVRNVRPGRVRVQVESGDGARSAQAPD